jgi:hypothetical protein
MPRAGFEPTIPATKRPRPTKALFNPSKTEYELTSIYKTGHEHFSLRRLAIFQSTLYNPLQLTVRRQVNNADNKRSTQ